jgi:methylated-DNA-[protein]-cysteine S-methyltransferase
MIFTCTVATQLGAMTAAAENEALLGLWFIAQKHYPAATASWVCEPGYPLFTTLRLWLSRYFSGENDGPELQLAPQGSPFQMTVWAALRRIPYGNTVTYGDIAKELARLGGGPPCRRRP